LRTTGAVYALLNGYWLYEYGEYAAEYGYGWYPYEYGW
jgi:hypothetical protein